MYVHQVWCELVEHNSLVRFQTAEDQVAAFYDSQDARRVYTQLLLHGVVEVGWSYAIMHKNETQLELNPPAYRQPVQL